MPYFAVDDIDIEVGDFLDSCNSRDIEKLIQYLIEDGYIDEKQTSNNSSYNQSLAEYEFNEVISKIAENRLRLTAEEDAILKKIADRF